MKTTSGFKRLFLAISAALVALPAMAQLNFNNPAINGAYNGIAVDSPPALPANRPSYLLTVSVNSRGQFTAGLKGALGNGSFRGTFSAAGAYTGNVNLGGSPTDVSLTIALEGAFYVINGTTARAGTTLSSFKLLRSPYSRTNPYPGAGRYTFSAPAPALTSTVLGDLIGTATINTDGSATVRGYLPDGTGFSCGSRVLNPHLLPVQAAAGRPTRTVTGSLTINPLVLPVFSDLTGSLRIVCPSSVNRGVFSPGYDEVRAATGSLYVAPAFQQLAATWFTLGGFNTVFNATNGELNPTQLVANWTPNGKMASPYYTDYGFSASANNSNGEIAGTYSIKVNRNLAPTVSNNAASFRAVVLQKQNTVSGYYLSPAGSGRMTLTPNTGGLLPDFTIVAPESKGVNGFGLTYSVSVITQGDWVVEIPAEATWVTTDLAGGTDNDTVLVTVAPNETNFARSTTIKIAESSHYIYQAARTASISPASRTVSAAGGTYNVAVNTIGGITADVVTGADWITATVDDATRQVTLVIAANTLTTSRTGTVNIAGRIHTVTQRGVSVKISSSKSPYIPANGGVYQFTVTADGPWVISLPDAWVSVSINGVAQVPAATAPLPYTFTGTGNATIGVTVAGYSGAGSFPVVRQSTIDIGGRKHVISQDWKFTYNF